jgi:hypothetical protein
MFSRLLQPRQCQRALVSGVCSGAQASWAKRCNSRPAEANPAPRVERGILPPAVKRVPRSLRWKPIQRPREEKIPDSQVTPPFILRAGTNFSFCLGEAGARGLAGTAPDNVGLPEFGAPKGATNGFGIEFYVLTSSMSSSDGPARCQPTRAPRGQTKPERYDRAKYSPAYS